MNRTLKPQAHFFVFAAGLIFGSGLVVSGMSDPRIVLQFLSISDPYWNPALGIVLASGVLVYAAAFQFMKNRQVTFFDSPFSAPAHKGITPRLLLGSVIFGVGWGFSGLCPAPALMQLATLRLEAMLFVGAMFVGFLFARGD